MEENRGSNMSNTQAFDETIQKMEEYARSQNWKDFHTYLGHVKSKLEQIMNHHYHDVKFLFKQLTPILVRAFESLLGKEDETINNIKAMILDLFTKMVNDDSMVDAHQMVLNLVPKIIEKETEEIAIKAIRVFNESYKAMKQTLGFQPLEKVLEIVFRMFNHFESIVEENYSNFIVKENIDRQVIIRANKSFKLLIEIPVLIILAYNFFKDQSTALIISNVPVLIKTLQVLKTNPYKLSDDVTKKIQINIYEDYIYTLTKILYLIAFLIKVNDSQFEKSFLTYSEQVVKAIIHIIENIPKENIATRKEILSITKNLIKPFAQEFYANSDFFRNEENLLGRSVISYDYIFYDVNKVLFALIDHIQALMTYEEKANLLEDLILKLNNYKIGYEFKLFIFYYINSLMDTLKNTATDNTKKTKLYYLNNTLLRELSHFFDTLDKIIHKLDGYFYFTGSDKTSRVEHLDRNLFENEDIINKPIDIHAIQQINIGKVYELILNNEFEKFIPNEDNKFIIDILKHINSLIKLSSALLHNEINNTYNMSNLFQHNITIQGNGQSSQNSNVIIRNDFILNQNILNKAHYLKKIFKSYFKICEKIFKNHSHPQSSVEDSSSAKYYEIYLLNIYITLPHNLCSLVFQKLLPFIFKAILNNAKNCPVKNCLISTIIETIFEIQNGIDQNTLMLRKELFDVFLEFFMNKIQYIGNNLKSYEDNNNFNQVSMSVLINIFKALFKYLLNLFQEEKTKWKIANFLITCLLLTKNSKFFGNYIYVIRCLFKNLLQGAHNPSNLQQQNVEFYKETIHLVFGIMKFMISIKEDFPFLKEMLTEIIMIFPIKFKYMIEYARIVFPSLIDGLNMNQEIIPIALQYLEQWMNALFHKPENVNPFLQTNINLLTTFLTSHLYKNYSISLNSLKLLSKFGGKSRNYLEDKLINPKTSPTNILVMNLSKQSGDIKAIDFPIDYIVDLCIKIVTNYKRQYDKQWVGQIKTSFKTLKTCFMTFIGEPIDEKFIEDIIRKIKENNYKLDEEYMKRGFFKKFFKDEEQVKVNFIYRKAEHFLVEKLLRGLFLCCTIPEIEDEIKDFVKFICDYFVLIMLSKNSNNKNVHVFEIDPTIILDIICEFLFSNNPTVFKNNNQTCISIAMKLINIMIDTIESIFDKDYEMIKSLEIVEIIFMKFLNACYNNEWSKKGGGLVTLLILIKRFTKDITFQYLRQILRAVFLVTNNYPSIVKIKYEGDSESILEELINIFILNSDKNSLVHTNFMENTFSKDQEMFHSSLLYFNEEILNNLHSTSDYARKNAQIAYNLIMKDKVLQKLPTLFFLVDSINKRDFFTFYNNIERQNYSNTQIIKMFFNDELTMTNKQLAIEKMHFLMRNLSEKLEFTNSVFLPMVAYATCFVFLFKSNINFWISFIHASPANYETYLKVVKNILDILVVDMYLYLEITKRIHDIHFNSKFKYFFIEKFYSTKQLHLQLSLKVDDNTTIEFENEIPEKHTNDILKMIFNSNLNYIFEQYTHTNSAYTSIEPFITDIFPIYSTKIKMMKYFIKILKYLLSNKTLVNYTKEKFQSGFLEKHNYDRLTELRNKCTSFIFRIIIYREEKRLLKVSKKYIKSCLKLDGSPKTLLPEDELRNSIKPILEQVARNGVISYKLIESLAILLKLLSSNFNDQLGKKFLNQIVKDNREDNNPPIDNYYAYAILSLFSHLKPNQVKDFPIILDIILKAEKESFLRNKNLSFFNTQYKNKIIKLLSNFSESFCEFFDTTKDIDISLYNFMKKLINDNNSYIVRDNLWECFKKTILGFKLFVEQRESSILNYLKVLRLLVKKAPTFLHKDIQVLIILNNYFENYCTKLYSTVDRLEEADTEKMEKEKLMDEILKQFCMINIIYATHYKDHNEILFKCMYYKKKTRNFRIQEKIKLFCMKELNNEMSNFRIQSIASAFVINIKKFAIQGCLADVIRYILIPMLVFYIKNKNWNDYIEKIFFKSLHKIFTEELVRLYDDVTNLELIKLVTLIIAYLLSSKKEINDDQYKMALQSMGTFIQNKYNTNSHSLTLYSCLGLALIYILCNNKGEKILVPLNGFFSKPNVYDYQNIVHLSYDIIIPYCMSRGEEATVIKNFKSLLNEKISAMNQFYQFFAIIIRFPELFTQHKMQIANLVVTFIIRSIHQHSNAVLIHKKITSQLLGLLILWFRNERIDRNDANFIQVEKLKENTLLLLTKYYRIVINAACTSDPISPEHIDLAKKYLYYIKELVKSCDFHIKKFFLITEQDQPTGLFINAYILLLKLAILYARKDSVLQNIETFFNVQKQLSTEQQINIKAIVDIAIILKCIINETAFFKLNENKEPVEESVRQKARVIITKNIKEFFDHHNNAFTRRRGRIIDLDFERVSNSDIRVPEVVKDLYDTFKSRYSHNTNITIEKLYEIFPQFEFRYFTLFTFYINDNLPTLILDRIEILDNVVKTNDSLLKFYLENWLMYTLILYQHIKEDEERIKKNSFEVESEYFSSGQNYFTNLRSYENLEKLKADKYQKIIILEKKPGQYDIVIETVLLGFYLILNNKNLLNTYKHMALKFLMSYMELFHNTFVNSQFEYLISLVLNSATLLPSELNNFVVDILKIFDYYNKKISPNLVSMIIDYVARYTGDHDSSLKEIIKILLYVSRFQEYKLRKRIFKIFEQFNDNKLFTKLKWIFQFDSKHPDVENQSWLPYSVDLLLHHFQSNEFIKRKDYSSLLKSLNEGERMIVDDEVIDGMIVDSDERKFKWIKTYNDEITGLKSKNLLIPIRDIVLGELSISQKMWFSIFPQMWRILIKDEQEMLAVNINDFLISLTNCFAPQKGQYIVKAMLESFANCFPLIKLNPEVLYTLAKNQSSWNAASFYLEKMLVSNIERERCFNCLSRILDTLKEEDHNYGLKRFITDNPLTRKGLSLLQTTNYYEAEKVFIETMTEYKKLLDKSEMSSAMDIDGEVFSYEIPHKIDFSIWEQGLIDCYRNTNKWEDLYTLSDQHNNLEIKIEALWHLDKWDEIEQMNVHKYHYLAKINQIYMMMKRDSSRADSTYQQKCMECIRTIFSDFSSFPPNFEKLNYNYYLIFQLIVEAWESTNTLKEIEKNLMEKKSSDFRENLIMWRDRIPHECEGFYSLKSILDPRNYLFKLLRELINKSGQSNSVSNISDHIWNNMIFIRFARKLKLKSVYFEYLDKFEKAISQTNYKELYPVEIYNKNMEHFKFVRQFESETPIKGLREVEEVLKHFSIGGGLQDVEKDIRASYLSIKAYFLYKLERYGEAQTNFEEAVNNNSTDYRIWKDWAEMCEKILNMVKPESYAEKWFENTVYNYIMVIVHKLDKSRYIIPKLFTLFKKHNNHVIDNRYDIHLEHIPTWIWLFWIPQVLDLLKSPNHSYFSRFILQKLCINYPQIIYYPLTNLMTNYDYKDTLEPFKSLIIANDKYHQTMPKIDLLRHEIEAKLERNLEEKILTHLSNILNIQNWNDQSLARALSILLELVKSIEFINIDYLGNIVLLLKELRDNKNTTYFDFYEKIKSIRYYLQSKIITESNFKDLRNVVNCKLYNARFDDVEIPGFFAHKLTEPQSDNKIFISRIESEFCFKFINYSHKKLLIRGSNEKLYNFSIVFDHLKDYSEGKLIQLETIMNSLYASNKDTYRSNVKFNIPIKYYITNNIKLIQEDANQYYMNEVFEFCMQKFGYDPELAYSLYVEEARKKNIDDFNNEAILKSVYYKMLDRMPSYNLKNFIHKFIINCDEIFIFRKQFATSLAINNLLSYVLKLQNNSRLNRITFNKETGSITLQDIKYDSFDRYNSVSNKPILPFRITKNIENFLSPTCLFGVLPAVIYSASNAIIEKSKYMKDVLFTCLYHDTKYEKNIDPTRLTTEVTKYANLILEEFSKLLIKPTVGNPMEIILNKIDESINDKNLEKMNISWDPWF